MADDGGEMPSSLRERKKQRTRATLIDAAIELCLKQGYEQTTVEQIAAVADVSPRTFSRYFATKDAVFMTLIEDYAVEVAAELVSIPADYGPLQALHAAHVAALTRMGQSPTGRLSTERVVLMLRVINGSRALGKAVFELRHKPTDVLIAERMGVAVGDRRRRLASAVFTATIATACGDLVADVDGAPLGPNLIVDRLNEACAQVADFATDMKTPVDLSDPGRSTPRKRSGSIATTFH